MDTNLSAVPLVEPIYKYLKKLFFIKLHIHNMEGRRHRLVGLHRSRDRKRIGFEVNFGWRIVHLLRASTAALLH
jgi:hypothetical protein